ncbi:helix-turn-helix transcriptional regulator [Kamptonema sp. UHCC 0994]|uniref:helix-turn-helix transcriptional regulator n=1 Tax=Kamptonema sp. UHCC 0994 TaxID=3031329 RepID=UPI0023B9960F|nr:helix-turn-helix transcriptional regulator [Kamptonema sp. UHCC 0994]MDF0554902.1 helix-turn-helix transcriptional regulator [Kamptonema sp. UHCC 0994]
MDKQKLMRLIKEARGERSQREFAKLIGTSQATISDWEKGKYVPTLENAEILAQCLGIDLTEFVARAEGRTRSTSFEELLQAIDYADWPQLAQIQRAIAHRMENH